jgi:hypothetical protein
MKVKALPVAIFAASAIALAFVGYLDPVRIFWSHSTPHYELAPAVNPQFLVQLGLTAALALASLFVILSKRYSPSEKHWAFGTIGTLLGFWLKG